MPLHDFWCAVCGQVICDVYRPVTEIASAHPPDHCGRPMAWVAAAPALHYGDVKGAAFHAFDTTDGRGDPVHIDSLRKLRQVEQESEVHTRNGEGQPMVFRRWAQDPSNRDQPTLSKDYRGGEQPAPAAAHRFGESLRKSAEEPDHAYGPAVSDANTSALPMSGKD
jgi:hypothetical protein